MNAARGCVRLMRAARRGGGGGAAAAVAARREAVARRRGTGRPVTSTMMDEGSQLWGLPVAGSWHSRRLLMARVMTGRPGYLPAAPI